MSLIIRSKSFDGRGTRNTRTQTAQKTLTLILGEARRKRNLNRKFNLGFCMWSLTCIELLQCSLCCCYCHRNSHSSPVHGEEEESSKKNKGHRMNNKTILQLAKGFRGRSKNCIRVARERVEKALQYAYRDRRNKKRDMRALWIQRINAGTRQHGVERSISLSQCLYQIIVSPPIPPPNIFLLLALSLMFLR